MGGVSDISGGGYHSLALRTDGSVLAWGYNGYGELGNNSTTLSSVPIQAKGIGGAGILSGVGAISAGAFHSIALGNDGTVLVWGYNIDGEVGDGTTANKLAPIRVVGIGGSGYLSGVASVSAGWYHSLALANPSAPPPPPPSSPTHASTPTTIGTPTPTATATATPTRMPTPP